MGVFTLEELNQLPLEQIYLVQVFSALKKERDAMEDLFIQEAFLKLDKAEKKMLADPNLSSSAKAKGKEAYARKRFEIITYRDFAATVVYGDGEGGYVDLIENKALDETDFILADSFVPITFYLDEEHSNLVFSSVCSFGTGEISIRLNDKRFSYFDSDTQQYMSGPFLQAYYQLYQKKALQDLGKQTDFQTFHSEVIHPKKVEAYQKVKYDKSVQAIALRQ